MTRFGRLLAFGIGAAGLVASVAYSSEQTVLGATLIVRSTRGVRSVKGSAKEKPSPNSLIGNPALA